MKTKTIKRTLTNTHTITLKYTLIVVVLFRIHRLYHDYSPKKLTKDFGGGAGGLIDGVGVGPLQRIRIQHPFDELLEVFAHVADQRRPDERQRLRVAFEHQADRQTLVTVADLHARQRLRHARAMSAREHAEIAGRTRTTL